MEEGMNGCSLLVVSCDAYADLWTPFFNLLRRHWGDCPFPVYLGSGLLDGQQPGVTTLYSNGGRDWSRCMSDYLEALATPYVLLMLDDFFLRRAVLTPQVLHCLEFAKARDAVQVRLIPRPGPTERVPGETIVGGCAAGLPYRLSTQAAIWNRGALVRLLRPGETIWEFEHNGNERALANRTGYYSTWREVLPYQGLFAHHVVEKGKWLLHEKWIFGRQCIGCDFTRRGTLPLRQMLFYHAIRTMDNLLGVFPWKWKNCIKRRLKRLLDPLLHRQFSRISGVSSRSSDHRKSSTVGKD
jgi:hypothetical protein